MIAVAPASSRIGQRQSLAGDGDHAAIALQGASGDGDVALCAAVALPAGDDAVPEWIHLLPLGDVRTVDRRGPYKVGDPQKIVAASLQAAGGHMPVDENHASDLAAPRGEPAPARGWIAELQARADGIWGRVDWTAAGRQLVADKAYRFISPVITHLKDGTVTALLRASLINRPNLRGLAALNQETTMNPTLAAILKKLGLKDDADETTALNAIDALATSASATALQAATAPIAKAVGLKDDADQAAILAAVTTLAAGDGATDKQSIVALQAEVNDLAGKLKTATENTARDKATAYVDGEIARGRTNVKPLRDHYIARHMADPAAVEREISSFVVLGPSGAGAAPPTRKDKDGKVVVSLNAEQANAAKLLGIPEDKFAATIAAEQGDAEAA